MKKFVSEILIIGFVLYLFFWGITFITDSGLKRTEFGNFNDWNKIFNKEIQPTLIIQGSSRAWVQYDTKILDSLLNVDSYNMGMDGSPFDVQYLRFRACVSNGIIPKIIIQNVDWDLLTRNDPPYQSYQFIPYLDHPDFKKDILKYRLLKKKDVQFSFLKYSGNPKAIITGVSEFLGLKQYKSDKYKGFKGSNDHWDNNNFNIRKQEGVQPLVIDASVESMFDEFLLFCNSNNIKVILVYSPPYYEINSIFDKQKLDDYYNLKSKEFAVPYIDMSSDSLSLNKLNYYNGTHMNKNGAELFTRHLADKVGMILKNAN